MKVLQTAGSDNSAKYIGDKKSPRDSQRQRKHFQFDAGGILISYGIGADVLNILDDDDGGHPKWCGLYDGDGNHPDWNVYL